jgi:hypothetical protein
MMWYSGDRAFVLYWKIGAKSLGVSRSFKDFTVIPGRNSKLKLRQHPCIKFHPNRVAGSLGKAQLKLNSSSSRQSFSSSHVDATHVQPLSVDSTRSFQVRMGGWSASDYFLSSSCCGRVPTLPMMDNKATWKRKYSKQWGRSSRWFLSPLW